MRAAMIYGPRDIRMETVEHPSIKKDEILVKVKACGICGTDIQRLSENSSPNGYVKGIK